MEQIKIKLIIKWTKQFIQNLDEIQIICPDDKLSEFLELKGDLEICEKVYNLYSNLNY